MKAKLAALLLPIVISATGCARSEPVQADPDEIEAAVKDANDQAAATRDKQGA